MLPVYKELLLAMQITWRYQKKHALSLIQDKNQEFLSITSVRKEVDLNSRGFETA